MRCSLNRVISAWQFCPSRGEEAWSVAEPIWILELQTSLPAIAAIAVALVSTARQCFGQVSVSVLTPSRTDTSRRDNEATPKSGQRMRVALSAPATHAPFIPRIALALGRCGRPAEKHHLLSLFCQACRPCRCSGCWAASLLDRRVDFFVNSV